MSWQEIEFERLYAIPSKNGLTRPARVRGSGYKMINMGELFAHDRIADIEMELVPMSEKELSTMLVEPGDLLFARQSLVLAGAGKCSIVAECNGETTFESHLIRVRLNQETANPIFYFYYFKSPKSRIRSIVTQGVQAGIRGNDLKKLKVHVPPIAEQQYIASVLSKYDDLIENNRRRIKLLEQAARLLYKEWFVHLRFPACAGASAGRPGHEHVKIIDGVPEGWKEIQVKDILAKVRRPCKIKKEDYLKDGLIPCVDQSREFIGGYTNNQKAVIDIGKPVIVFGDHTRNLKFIDFPFACGADGTQIIVSNNDKISQEYLYFALDSIDLSNYFYARHFKFLKDQHILLPLDWHVSQFTGIVQPIMKQIKILREQITNLSQARDLLLPRLMDRKIAV